MWHSGLNPLKRIRADAEPIVVPKTMPQRRLHKAFLRYHDPNNWPLLREALKAMGRADLIGPGKHQLVPSWQPAGTGGQGEGKRIGHKGRQRPGETKKFLTKGVMPRKPSGKK